MKTASIFRRALLHPLSYLTLVCYGLAVYAAEVDSGENIGAAASPGLLEQGRQRFTADCAFCHGRDAAGGSRGLDLIRSELVAQDDNGSLIGEVIRQGRADKGMPAFTGLGDSDVAAIAAFIHDQKRLAEAANGGRRSVQPEDVAIGDPVLGKIYFDDNCGACHSAADDLAGIASRLNGLPLLMRMLYPGSERRGAERMPAGVRVLTENGDTITGMLAHLDEFTVALRDENEAYRSWPRSLVTLSVEDPLQAHVDQLARYRDEEMHNVLAYLLTLR